MDRDERHPLRVHPLPLEALKQRVRQDPAQMHTGGGVGEVVRRVDEQLLVPGLRQHVTVHGLPRERGVPNRGPHRRLGMGLEDPFDAVHHVVNVGALPDPACNRPGVGTAVAGVENVVALADVDWARGAQGFKTWPKATKYKDFRVMLEKEGKNIDAVTIGIPDFMHATVALHCMQHGKHVYLEKPLTRTVWESRLLQEAAVKYKVATQMGNQGRSGDGARLTREWIRHGAIGRVREVHAWHRLPGWPQGMANTPAPTPVPSTLDWNLWLGTAAERPFVDGIYHPANLLCPFRFKDRQYFTQCFSFPGEPIPVIEIVKKRNNDYNDKYIGKPTVENIYHGICQGQYHDAAQADDGDARRVGQFIDDQHGVGNHSKIAFATQLAGHL